jgi:serine phosphatase RsbU (regulator of sigma subunit)
MSYSGDKTIGIDPLPRAPRPGVVHSLVIVEGTGLGRRFELGPVTTVGRDPTCVLRLDDPSASRLHCRLELDGRRLIVIDDRSTNGTFVDGLKVAGRAELGPAGLLQVGSHLLRHEVRTQDELRNQTELTADLGRAKEYVAALLPPAGRLGSAHFDWSYRPSAVLGGDLFGYTWLDERKLAVYLLDVSGHGVGAAMHSASVQNVLRNHSLPRTDFARPAQVLERLNEKFPMESHGGLYFSIWYGVYDAQWRSIDFCSGGHPPALLLDRRQGQVRRLHTRNPPIGALEAPQFLEASAAVEPGEQLYLFSDGVYEVTPPGGEQWCFDDFEKLVVAIGPRAARPAEDLQRTVLRASGRPVLPDDFSLLVVDFDA